MMIEKNEGDFWQQPKSNSRNDQLHGNSRTGLICAPLTESRCKELLHVMVSVILIPWKLRSLFP
jgi:hypothetical protein